MSTTTDLATALAPSIEPPAPYARWLHRVGATIIDDLMLGGAALATGHVVASDGLGLLSPSPTWVGSVEAGPVVVLTLLVMLTLQAYVGATPGKLLLGIAVVGDGDARPIGLVRTGGRWLCHLIDAILLIGYLRPVWNSERRTFADTFARTVVVRTRSPRPHARLARWTPDGQGPPVAWSAPVRPRWHGRLTWAAGLVALPMIAAGMWPVSFSTDDEVRVCDTGRGLGEPGLSQVVLTVDEGTVRTRALWWESVEPDGRPGVRVDWRFEGDQPMRADLHLALRNRDGSGRSFDLETVETLVVDEPPEVLSTPEWGVVLDPSVLDGLEEGWGWEAGATVDGVDLGSCGEAARP